ncbi:MAG: DUF3486 family protein [Azonexus sp.]|jgi:hypothetical protein|nr:DUF3486 family protein [Azonexus sp.]
MPQPKKVDLLPEALRAELNRVIKANGYAGYEAISAWLSEQGHAIGKSALAEHGLALKEIVRHERDMQLAAEAMVGELGEDFDAKSGALLAQAVSTLAGRAAMSRVVSQEVMEIGDILDLARAAKTVQEARSGSLKERQAAQKAREQLLAEQRNKLDALGQSGAVPSDVLAKIIKAAYDL